MINSYYTLLRLAGEIGSLLEDSRVIGAVTRKKSTLEIFFRGVDSTFPKLVVSCLPQDNHVFFEESGGQRTKGANVMTELTGKTVRSVEMVENERIICLRFSDNTRLDLTLFGSAANVYLADAAGVIVNSFLKPAEHIGTKPSLGRGLATLPVTADELEIRLRAAEGDLLRKLVRSLPSIDSNLAREVLYRFANKSHQEFSRSGANVALEGPEGVVMLFRVLESIIEELRHPAPRIYTRDGKGVAFGLIDLTHLEIREFREYVSVNEAVRDFVFDQQKNGRILQMKSNLLGRVNDKLDRLRRTLSKIDDDVSGNRAERHRLAAEHIMSHLDSLRKGDEKLRIETGEGTSEIRLDPSLTPVQNAQAYFERSKRARTSLEQAKTRRLSVIRNIEREEGLKKDVEASFDISFLKSLKPDSSHGEEGDIPFRTFEKNGHKIYVGKDAKNNEELTFSFARPNDVFLHARGVSGSHVIIRNPSREFPDASVIRFAASIAGHYSKARTSAVVPVAYTMRKFVKKAKGRPGAVLLDREEVVFVEPGIPQL